MNNRIGFHMNYFRGTPYEFDVISAARRIRQAGGNAIEVMPAHLYKQSASDLETFKSLLADLDIELIVGAGRSPETDASSSDPVIREQSFQASQKVLALVNYLGGHKWDGLIHAAWPGQPSGVLTPSDKQLILERCAAEMNRILPLAEDYDVDFCFEVVNRFEHYLLNTAEEGIAFCDMLKHPHAAVLLDTFHMNIEEHSITEAITAGLKSGYLKHFHVSEANRSVPGTVPSHMDWQAIFNTLVENGYEGTIICEPFIVCGVPFSNTSAIWRDLTYGASFESFLGNIDTAVAFIREHLERTDTDN